MNKLSLYSPGIYRKAKRLGVHVMRIDPWGAEVFVFRGVERYVDTFKALFGIPPNESDLLDVGHVLGFYTQELIDPAVNMHAHIIAIGGREDSYPEDTVWHEALHCTIHVLDHFGVTFEVDNHEVFTYTQGFIVNEIRQHLYGLPGFDC